MDRDDIVEDLADREEESCRYQIDHRFALAKDSQNQNGLQDEVEEEEDQRTELVKDVESNVAIRTSVRRLEMTSPVECGVEGDVASTDEKCSGTPYYQSY